MAFEALKEELEQNGFAVSVFATGQEAADYLNRQIDGVTVGLGGSMTLKELGLQESLSRHNILFSHGYSPAGSRQVQELAAGADVYILSANGIAEDTGEILNIDGNGNRVASSLFGHRKVYIVAGRNKISPRFCQRPPPGAQRGGPEERPAAEPQDPLRGERRQMLRLLQPGAHLQRPGGVLQERLLHGDGSGAGGPGAGLLTELPGAACDVSCVGRCPL